MKYAKVVTWSTPRGQLIDITPPQERKLRAAGVWPKNDAGEEYCQVSHGLHPGHPHLSDDQIDMLCQGAHLSEIREQAAR